MSKVGIINYGLGNINSLVNMVEKVGGSAVVIDDSEDLKNVDRLILPGVGAFDYGINLLKEKNFFHDIERMVLKSGIPILGVCLGAQLLTGGSEEGKEKGLGWIQGSAKRFVFEEVQDLRIPHVGWNDVKIVKKNKLVKGLEREARFYFTHSYYIVLKDECDDIGLTEYGHNFVSIFNRNNIYGVQFHPEKSHKFGMNLIKNFLSI